MTETIAYWVFGFALSGALAIALGKPLFEEHGRRVIPVVVVAAVVLGASLGEVKPESNVEVATRRSSAYDKGESLWHIEIVESTRAPRRAEPVASNAWRLTAGGFTCAVVRNAGTSDAATTHRAGTRPRTTKRRDIRS